jgi:hypothetical protein
MCARAHVGHLEQQQNKSKWLHPKEEKLTIADFNE